MGRWSLPRWWATGGAGQVRIVAYACPGLHCCCTARKQGDHGRAAGARLACDGLCVQQDSLCQYESRETIRRHGRTRNGSSVWNVSPITPSTLPIMRLYQAMNTGGTMNVYGRNGLCKFCGQPSPSPSGPAQEGKDQSAAMHPVPVTHKEANDFVRRLHRHSKPTLGSIFCVGVSNGNLCGVAIVGRPVARLADDGNTVEVLRVATDGARNACSMLYRICQRVAKELGYTRVITYTLPEEGGASLRGAGFVCDGEAGSPAKGWHNRPNRHAEPVGNDLVGGKLRWSWTR